MSFWRLVCRSLLHHWRIHLAVALGVAAATAVLTGALLVGDSMRGSLREMALGRLGRIDHVLVAGRFFRAELAGELAGDDAFRKHFSAALPAIMVRGTVENTAQEPENRRRAGRVSVLGCPSRFWTLGTGGPRAEDVPGRDEIVLNRPLADELRAGVGDEVMLRVGRVSRVSPDSALGRKTDRVASRRLRVTAIVEGKGLGAFSLRPNQQLPRNAFVSTGTLQSMLDRPGKVNAILVAGRAAELKPAESDEADRTLRAALRPTPADYGLSVERVRIEGKGKTALDYYNLTSDRMILSPEAVEAAMTALGEHQPQPAFTYLANYITAGDGKAKIPYSTVTAIDSSVALGPLLVGGKPPALADDGIVLNRWAVEDMARQGVELHKGDPIKITFFEPESTDGQLRERTETFRFEAAAPLAEPGEPPERTNDPHLTPEVEGVTDAESINNPIEMWEPPFPLDKKRIRYRKPNDQDEQYWRDYGPTPKAFISLAAGRRLWKSRFGETTSVRIAHRPGLSEDDVRRKLLAQIDPGRLGFVFQNVRRQSLKAAEGTTSFSGLFLGFSFFLIAAAVMLVALLFGLGVQQRAVEVGVLAAVGLRRRRIALLLAAEGLIVAAVGGLLGTGLGVGYARLMIAGLQSPRWWLAAVVNPFLKLHVAPTSLAVGFCAGVAASLMTVGWTLWRMRRVSVRRLLAGEAAEPAGAARHGRWSVAAIVAWVLLAVAAASAVAATQMSGEAEAGAFFSSGAAVLAALLLFVRGRLRAGSRRPDELSLGTLALRNIGRNPTRSTLTIGLVASAGFLIVAIGAFRVDPADSGTGGFDLVAETDQPIFFDLNTKSGREQLGILDDQWKRIAPATVVSLRAQPGDDASCLNLYRPRQPRVLGVTPAMIGFYSKRPGGKPSGGGAFGWAETAAATPEEKANPWLLLEKPPGDGAVPVVLDMSTAMYSMHLFTMKGVGTTFQIEDGRGRKVRLRIVGLLSNSIFQGNLLIAESQFRRLFPEVAGYRYFLIRTEPVAGSQESESERAGKIISLLESKLGDQGFDAERTGKKLESLLAVQNTYLSTFQSLGALGLLLGTFGLATVQLRSVLERRGELALLRAAGLRRSRLAWMVMLESSLLLLIGLAVGVAAAAAAVLPHWLVGGAAVPLGSLAVMLAVVLAVGLASGFASVQATLRAPLLAALRGD